MVAEISNVVEFASAVKSQERELVIIDFFADWCGPCKRIAPFFEELATKYPNVGFYKINTDNMEINEIIGACKIEQLPTFCIFYKGEYKEKMTGINILELENLINKYFI